MSTKFIIESNNIVFDSDLSIIRRFYQPIVGSVAICMYHYLYDMSIKSTQILNSYDIDVIASSLRTSVDEIRISRRMLEAIGLLRTFQDLESKTLIFSIQKPLNREKFLHNKILLNSLKKALGSEIFETLLFSTKGKELNKTSYENISAKYHEVFEFIAESDAKTTQEIPLPSFNNTQEAIIALSPELFYRFLINEAPSVSIKMLLDSLIKEGFSERSVNLLINYSFVVNGKVVINYIRKIANNLFSQEIIGPDQIQKELEAAQRSKLSSIKSQISYKSLELEGEDLDSIFKELKSI